INRRKTITAYNSRFAKAGVLCFYESEVLNSSFVHLMKFSAENRHLRQARNRSEEIPSGFPRYGSGLHTSSTALRDCPGTWVSRKRETCVKPRAVVRHSKTEPNKMKDREEKLRTIIEWSEKNEDVRVLLLTSSLVNPLALVDEFSDLDIEFVFEDNTNYISDKSWTLKFGNPIAMIEEDESCFNHKHAMKMLLNEDGVKVDFKLYSKSKFIKETQEKELPEDWDIGYKILIDKDGITKQMLKPTYQISIIKKPSEKE